LKFVQQTIELFQQRELFRQLPQVQSLGHAAYASEMMDARSPFTQSRRYQGLMPMALTLRSIRQGKGTRDGEAAFLYKLR
jgi:hypothetical protein